MIKDIILFMFAVQILIDVVSAKVISNRLNKIEDRFFRKHEADVRHRNKEVQARSEQINSLRQRLHNETQRAKKAELYCLGRAKFASHTAGFVVNELSALKTRVKNVKP